MVAYFYLIINIVTKDLSLSERYIISVGMRTRNQIFWEHSIILSNIRKLRKEHQKKDFSNFCFYFKTSKFTHIKN